MTRTHCFDLRVENESPAQLARTRRDALKAASLTRESLIGCSTSMHPEYLDTWFWADVPADGWPSRFGVVTAFNPNGVLVEQTMNTAADEDLRERLRTSDVPFG